MPRRNRIPFEHCKRLVRAFEDVNEDYLIVADTLGINRSTARSIVSRYVREGRIVERPRGGPNHVRVDNEMRDCLNEILNENCLLTLTQLNQELRQRLPQKPRICDRTVARTLEGMLFCIKLARPVPADRNRPDVIQKRLDYANWFMGHAVVNQCFHRRMWIQYLDGKNSRERKERGTGLQTGLWSARKKCNCHNGHFTHQWSGFPLCSYWWDECTKI